MSPVQTHLLFVFSLLSYSLSAFGRQLRIVPPVSDNPLPVWSEDRFINCIFCMDYDDFKRMSIFGCRFRRTPTCVGTICYMRQHKSPAYFLYTSGCLNLTQSQFDAMQHLTSLQLPARSAQNASQLCEVTSAINTCVCSQPSCNNVSAQDPFKEYINPIFREANFDELAHFRHFLPTDPVLENMRQTNNRDEYFLIKSVMTGGGDRRHLNFYFISGLLITTRLVQINSIV